jgi:hypothetical protein
MKAKPSVPNIQDIAGKEIHDGMCIDQLKGWHSNLGFKVTAPSDGGACICVGISASFMLDVEGFDSLLLDASGFRA